jgi:hypothetical protein
MLSLGLTGVSSFATIANHRPADAERIAQQQGQTGVDVLGHTPEFPEEESHVMGVRRSIAIGIILGLLEAFIVAASPSQDPPAEPATPVVAPAPQLRIQSVRKPRVTAASPPQKVKLETIPGEKTVVSGDLMMRKIAASSKDAELKMNEYVVARWASKDEKIPPIAAREGSAWKAGFGFIGINRAGQEVRFRPVIEAAGGLALTGSGSSFQGRIFVGLRDNTDAAAAYALPQPVSLLVSGPADELTPRQLNIDHTNLPFTEVAIGARDPADPFDLSLIAAGTSERATVSLPVIRPKVELLPMRSRIQGLGLETSTISIRAVGVPDPGGRVVIVTSDFASVDPTQVQLDERGVGTTTVRSVSFGKASINAESPPLASAAVPVYFSWPIAFLLASVIGGLLGAALARLQSSGKKRSLRVVLIRGVLTGILMVALYAIGVNLLPIHPTATAGETLAFAVAAVGGFIGLKLK